MDMFLGELDIMPDHSAIVGVRPEKILVGYHTDDFRKQSRNEA